MDADTTDICEDDETHPIPYMSVIDVETTFVGGGAYKGITIASPLQADSRSQKRLLRKIELYIQDFHSEESKKRIGLPNREKFRIYVGIHPDSAPSIFQLLERCRPWVEDNALSLDVTTNIGVVTQQ